MLIGVPLETAEGEARAGLAAGVTDAAYARSRC